MRLALSAPPDPFSDVHPKLGNKTRMLLGLWCQRADKSYLDRLMQGLAQPNKSDKSVLSSTHTSHNWPSGKYSWKAIDADLL